jgi:AraC-like DNA-binding protein
MKDPDMNYLDAIEKIRSEILKSTKNETTVFVGSIQEGTANIHQSYNDAVALFEYEIFTGSNAILDHNAYLHSDTEYYYPMDIELSLISAVSNGNKQRVSQILNEIHEENFSKRQLRPDIAKLLLNELAGTTMKVTKNVDPDLSQNPVTEIMKCNTVEDVFFTLQDIYLKACEKNQETFGTVRKERFKQYIDQHYCDVDFSQSNMAEELGVSQNYLSSQFKAYFGVTMISYVNSLRAEKAASLLKNTEIPVQEIATACGFSNGDSLTRVFKKKYGVTPSDYRSGI